jgi:GR25 family glycosyltransferase involved in LPS biosynthesis
MERRNSPKDVITLQTFFGKKYKRTMNNPFNFFDKIFCINLDNRPDRWEQCLNQFKKLKIEDKVERFSAINFSHQDESLKKILGRAGCCLSHIEICKIAKENEFKNYLVFEDDFDLLGNEESILKHLNEYINQLPIDWDLYYLGGNVNEDYGKEAIEKFSHNLYKVNSCHTTHAFAINEKFYEKFLNSMPNIDNVFDWLNRYEAIDVFLSQHLLNNHKCYINNPMMALQSAGFSNIENNFYDYQNWMNFSFDKYKKIADQKNNVSVVFTSCGRLDLLEKTIRSFLQYNTYPIDKYIVIENDKQKNTKEVLAKIFKDLNFLLIINDENIGQVSSIDKAYSFVESEYIFHCEDDWEFYNKNFIQNSIDVLKHNQKYINVNIRKRFDGERGSMHPISEKLYTNSNTCFHEYEINYLGMWHGFCWNPGLRRNSDYKFIKNYKKYKDEAGVGNFYKENGYVAVCLEQEYCKHLGTNSFTLKSNQ